MKRVFLLAPFVVLAFVGMRASEPLQPDAPFSFVQITDPQFGMWANNANMEQEAANLEFAVATINRLRPAFVVVTGDLVNRAGDQEQVAAYLGIMAKVDPSIHVYNLPGNHDVGNTPSPESIALYVKRFGPDRYAFRRGSFAGIVLDSALMFAPEKAAEAAAEQDRWLRAELARARGDGVKHVVVFQHHPLFLKDPGEPDKYENIPLARRAKYLALFAEFGVKHVFAGHYHRNALARAGDIEMVTTGPIGQPLGEGAKSGMRIVTVADTGIEHRYYDLGELPNRVIIRALAGEISFSVAAPSLLPPPLRSAGGPH